MLLDMVLLGGGIETSLRAPPAGRGYEVRISPKGTLPFDTEASDLRRRRLVRALIVAEPGVVRGRHRCWAARSTSGARDALLTLFGYGIDPVEQSMYQLETGRTTWPGR